MNTQALQNYLHEHIPMSEAMQVSVESVGPDSIVLSAPLAPNINHQSTVFGGSASSVAILSAWSLVHTKLDQLGLTSRLVIQRNTMSYLLPISGAFAARATIPSGDEWERFLRTFQRKGKARIRVTSMLEFEGKQVGMYEGEFVAFGVQDPNSEGEHDERFRK